MEFYDLTSTEEAMDVQIVELDVAGWGEVRTAHFTRNLGYREAPIDIW